jgi:hypothetical protein
MKSVKKTSVKKYQAGGATPKGKIARLEKKEARQVDKGNKAVDEGRERKANRILGRAAKTEDRKIRLSEKMKAGGTAKPKAAYGMAVKPSMMQNGGERESFASRKIKTVSVSPDKNYKTTVKEKMGPSGVSTKVANRRTVKGVASGAPKPRMMKKGGTTKKK